MTALAAMLLLQLGPAHRTGGNRLAYLDELDPWWPDERSPKLTTPIWIGEEDAKAGVEAAIVLSIDDMRDPAQYETFLRPILARLQEVERAAGRPPRSPMSIFACEVKPEDPKQAEVLARLVGAGVSLEVHTVDHPCPLFRGGDLGLAVTTVVKCGANLAQVPGNEPVAFRMPCCDSLNTSSPRFYDAVLTQSLSADSSIAMAFTSDDPELPRELVQDPDGSERFLKYLPADRRFANYVTNYPYPYVIVPDLIGKSCWELPWIVPTDWQAQHLRGPNQEQTLVDLKAALDLTVLKQGLFTLVFHPHGWIKAEQIVALIDHAVARYGEKVRFLSVRDVEQRLARITVGPDLDEDGRLDVTVVRAAAPDGGRSARLGIVHADGRASRLLFHRDALVAAETHDGHAWRDEPELRDELVAGGRRDRLALRGAAGVRLLDLDGDGRCELVVADGAQDAVLRWDPNERGWRRLLFALPSRCPVGDSRRADAGVRFLDVDEDGDLDLISSGWTADSRDARSRDGDSRDGGEVVTRESGVWLFESLEKGWTTPINVVSAPLAEFEKLPPETRARFLPLITRPDGTNNGMWVKDRALWWVNEDTDRLPNHCDRRSFNELLAPAYPIGTEPPPRSPEASLRSLHLRPGFTAQLVASEPLVADPICVEWGADGKLWVVEMGDYPLGANGGRVKFLEDLNGDGVYDRATTFLDELPFPTSVLPWRDGVLVTAAPDLLFAADRDGDGCAEVKAVLFTGFGEGNPQHRVNGLRLGLDGWVYGANGDSDGEIVSTITGERVDISGRDWRCDPDRALFEPVTGCTQYGRDRDDFDHWFGGNNVVPAWHFVLEERYLRRNPFGDYPDPRVQVPQLSGSQPVFPASITRARVNDFDTANHFTSACSPSIYRDELFGHAFTGNLFVCEPVHNLVHREVVARKGVTFTSHRAADDATSEFLVSSDPWFRPVQARTGPDGALWVVDMYRDVIEHPEWIPAETQRKLDLRAGADRGRIYRVFPVDRSPRPFRKLDRATNGELVEALRSPNGWTRDTAQRLLVERRATDVMEEFGLVIAVGGPAARAQAIWTLERLDALSGPLPGEMLKDPDPEVVVQAIRMCEPRLADDPSLVQALTIFALAVPDLPSSVMLQLAFTLGESPDPGTGRTLARLSARAAKLDPFDARMIAAAAVSSLRRETIATFVEQSRADGVDATADGAANLARLAVQFGDFDSALALLHEFGPDRRGWDDAGRLAASIARTLDGLDERPDDASELSATLRERAAQARTALRRGGAGSEPAAALLLLGDEPSELAADLVLLASFVTPRHAHELAAAAVQRLSQIDDDSVPSRLLAAWKGASPQIRERIVDALLHRDEWIPTLFDGIEKETLTPRDLDLATRQRLLQHDDESIRARAVALLETRIDPDRQKVVDALRPALTLASDRARGQSVFERKCATCHQLRGIGHAVGPDLAAMADQSPEALLIALLDPNRAVEGRYVSYSALTKDGEIWTGILAEESSASVTLRDSGGKEQKVLRGDLQWLKSSAKSLMIEGLESEVTPQDLADLIAFLRDASGAGSTRPGKRIPGNEPVLVRPMGECNALHLTAATAEIYGPRLTFETQYKNLGWWQSGEDHAAWTFEPARAGRCEVVLDFACEASSAGGTLVLELGDQKLAFDVPSTGTWDDYREQTIGTLELAAGAQRLVARPAMSPASPLLDLREIRLVPKP